jgi:hypothetical protein
VDQVVEAVVEAVAGAVAEVAQAQELVQVQEEEDPNSWEPNLATSQETA